MGKPDFVVVGSSGGGGTISWMLARAGFDVVVLEQGDDYAAEVGGHLPSIGEDPKGFSSRSHDEYRLQRERPHVWKNPRGGYNTFRPNDTVEAKPLSGMGGITASVLGGGSVFWGAWAFRALPIDFRLRTHFKALKQLKDYEDWGYSVQDWPVQYSEMEPYFNVAETLLAVSGNRDAITSNIKKSTWYKKLSRHSHFKPSSEWAPKFEFPCPEIVKTPVGWFIGEGFDEASPDANAGHFLLPSGMVSPRVDRFDTREQIAQALKAWGNGGSRPDFWKQKAEEIWSDRVRTACNMCGYCGGFLCWGKHGPKSSAALTTLAELKNLPNADVRTRAKAYEVVYDQRLRRATGVRYLDLSDPDKPVTRFQAARNVVVSCGAVQSARLLLMSGPPGGLGNRYDQVGRNATFHTFDLLVTYYLPPEFQGYLHSEFAHTGNTATFENYFVLDDDEHSEQRGKWCKAGTMVSTAKHNPLGDALRYYEKNGKRFGGANSKSLGHQYLDAMQSHARKMQLRLTGDDLPMPRNRVDLDPRYVDEYGLPVARITRDFGPHERWMARVAERRLREVFRRYVRLGLIPKDKFREQVAFKNGNISLIGDHQHSTCRMGEDPRTSVVDRYCRLHDVPNVFIVDTGVFPTGFGLNPMVNVVANALRVGTHIVQEA